MKLKQTIIGVMLGLLLVVLVVGLNPGSSNSIMGDANLDGRITVTDSQLIARVVSGLEPSNCVADYDRSGRVTILDALKVAQIVAGTRLHTSGTCDDPVTVCGDVNNDNVITQADLNLLRDYVQGLPTPGMDITCADTTGGTLGDIPNGIIDELDAQMVFWYLNQGPSASELSFCNIPCRDPRTIPPPAPILPISVPMKNGMRK